MITTNTVASVIALIQIIRELTETNINKRICSHALFNNYNGHSEGAELGQCQYLLGCAGKILMYWNCVKIL